jgi:hypothetical protein
MIGKKNLMLFIYLIYLFYFIYLCYLFIYFIIYVLIHVFILFSFFYFFILFIILFSYFWQPTNEISQRILVTESNTYNVSVRSGTCPADSDNVVVFTYVMTTG